MHKIAFILLRSFAKLLALLPLPVLHATGAAFGWLLWLSSPSIQKEVSRNLGHSDVAIDPKNYRHILRKNIVETGKSILETLAIWQKPLADVIKWVNQRSGWDGVEAALVQGKGIIFLTPHLGCFEITSLYFAAHHPITILYRPPKQKWLLPLMESGRSRGQARLTPANKQGVRDLLVALKRGEAVGILPDQIPYRGEGEWAHYFGRPAYTMTLASRLAEKTGATVIMAFGERLPWGRGYHLHLTPLPPGSINSVQGLNDVVEAQVRACPAQYAWNYHRHRVSRRAKPLPPE